MKDVPVMQGERFVLAAWALPCAQASHALRALIKPALKQVPAKTILQLASDTSRSVYFLVEGWLVVSKVTPEGGRQIVDFVLPGNVFDPGSADALLSATDVAALTDARFAAIAREDWVRYLARHRSAQDFATRHAAAGYARIAERLLRLGTTRAETRIAYAVCELALRARPFGLVAGAGFHLPLTQQVLGEFVGLCSVHVSRTITTLTRQGILRYRNPMQIVIDDLDGLTTIAQTDPDDLRAAIIPML